MKLAQLATGTVAVPIALIGADRELTSDIQARLATIGLLDPPVDGKFGNVSHWALSVFLRRIGRADAPTIEKEAAAALLNVSARELT